MEKWTIPNDQELISTSSLLMLRPDLAVKSYAPEIAFEEYAHSINHTHPLRRSEAWLFSSSIKNSWASKRLDWTSLNR
jgi:hypothetical protein